MTRSNLLVSCCQLNVMEPITFSGPSLSLFSVSFCFLSKRDLEEKIDELDGRMGDLSEETVEYCLLSDLLHSYVREWEQRFASGNGGLGKGTMEDPIVLE